MLTFLRKVRRRLFTGNRITRYLAYAVGEIFLVVIGILIAIQLNTMKQERDMRSEMNQILAEVHRDLVTDSLRQNYIRTYYLGHTSAIQDLLEVRSGSRSMENTAIGRRLHALFFMDNYSKVSSTYESMISGGKMRNIEDADLANMMIRYYTNDGLEITTDIYGDILDSFDPKINNSPNLEALDRRIANHILQKEIPNYRPVTDTLLQSDYTKVIQEPWVDDFLVNGLNQCTYIFHSLNSVSVLNRRLREEIQTYLRERDAELTSEQREMNNR